MTVSEGKNRFMTKSIAVAGKGGTGKTTLAALIILELVRQGQAPVLAIDADPDANLGTLLGVEPHASIGDLREDIRKEMNNLPAGMSKASYFEAGLHQVIEEANGFDLITMGKSEGPGCYCSLNHLIRKFSENLTPSYRWMVLDNEAGLEHISRRTTSNIDALIVVVTDNPISFNTAKTIASLTANLANKIGKHYVVTNMVRPERKAEIQSRLAELPMEYLCDIPLDPQMEEIIYRGEPLSALPDDSVARVCVSSIVERIGAQDGSTT